MIIGGGESTVGWPHENIHCSDEYFKQYLDDLDADTLLIHFLTVMFSSNNNHMKIRM